MLKLVRKHFAQHILWDLNGNAIDWTFIKLLVNKQFLAGMKVANKLSDRHLNWESDKMKVCLAAQTLSRSVGISLDHIRQDLKVFLVTVPRFGILIRYRFSATLLKTKSDVQTPL